jgi:hypothetical protein
MVALLEGSPISTEKLQSSVRLTIGLLVTSLTKALLPRLLSLAGRPVKGRVLAVPNENDGDHCVLGDLQCCRQFLVPIPRSVPRHNPVSELYGQFLQTSWLGFSFALTCTVNCGTLYRQVCAFPNPLKSIEFTTGGLQVVETSQG